MKVRRVHVVLLIILLTSPVKAGWMCYASCYTTVIASGCVTGPAALAALGFTPAGVAAGSFAATWMSSIGAVSSGSLFATLQGLGASGVTFKSVFGAATAVCGTVCSE